MGQCDVCKKETPPDEARRVASQMDRLDIDHFEMVVDAMGIAAKWESAYVCSKCYDYYRW